MATGIFLEITCNCSAKAKNYCCTESNSALSIAAVPLIFSLCWLLISKILLIILLPANKTIKKGSHIRRKKNKVKVEEETCTASTVICYFFMGVIAICGLAAIGIYSFKFNVFCWVLIFNRKL